MKKIWPWLLLLLLLIIFCIWSKKKTIHIRKVDTQTVIAPVIEEVHYIEYVIAQDKNKYTLNGNFKNITQQKLLTNTVNRTDNTLEIQNTSTNETLHGEDALALTNKILPHFIKTYTNGKIHYSNQKIKISGTVESYEAQYEMQRLLNTSTLASQDNATVTVHTQPIYYSISKNKGRAVEAHGTFDNQKQINRIKTQLPDGSHTNFEVAPHHIDKGSIPIIEQFLPLFLTKYIQGSIGYEREILTIRGTVESNDDLAMVKSILGKSPVTLINKTTVDNSKALKAALDAKEKIRAEALKAQQEASAKKASLEAEEKVRVEALKAQQELKAKIKTKITHLLQLDNIEFNVNKSTLTQKGKNTVDKLAKILKESSLINIEIAGHTDSDGSATYNQKLSQARVDRVKSKLIADSINASRLTAKGYGETKPLVPNDTRENKAKNRRVEITILGE